MRQSFLQVVNITSRSAALPFFLPLDATNLNIHAMKHKVFLFLTVRSRKSISLAEVESRMARHKEFDRDETLQKAMEVFWSRGYEAASIGDLVKHMGINRQSLYDTFGDKHTL